MPELPRALTYKNVLILPTRFGWVFLVIVTAFLIGSFNYNNNIAFLMTFLLVSMAFMSIFHTYRNLVGIVLTHGRVTPVFAGENATFEIFIRGGFVARYAIDFSFSVREASRVDLRPGPDSRVKVNQIMPRRGLHAPGKLTVSTVYPLGLFRAWSTFQPDLLCLVYPRPLAGPFEHETGGSDNLDSGVIKGSGVDDFSGLRPYQSGDAPSHIAWKTLSRGRGLFVKEFVGLSGQRIIFNWDQMSEADTEKRLSRLCDLILQAETRKLVYGLVVPGTIIGPSSGQAHIGYCLKTLALHPGPELHSVSGRGLT